VSHFCLSTYVLLIKRGVWVYMGVFLIGGKEVYSN
jgi:hypothetical protein